jgi:pectinesterase
MRILLVGDSTVTDDEGWGRGLRARLAPAVECANHAKGGRSSKSYRDEGWWSAVLTAGPGPVLLQFGHNDQPGKGPERETDPRTTFAANLARYVTEARDAGLQPVLLTSLTRRQFDPTTHRLHDTLGPYAQATRRVAAELGVPLLDLYAASTGLVEKLGPEGCEPLSPVKPDGGFDLTHLNPAGAALFGGLVADLAADLPELRPLLIREASSQC